MVLENPNLCFYTETKFEAETVAMKLNEIVVKVLKVISEK